MFFLVIGTIQAFYGKLENSEYLSKNERKLPLLIPNCYLHLGIYH